MEHMVFEVGTALILIAIVSTIANKLKVSAIPFLIVLGMMVGPHAPEIGILDLTFTDSQEVLSFLGRIGVLFLLFYVGLEFRVSNFVKSGGNIFFGGTVYVILNFVLGLLYGILVKLPLYEALIVAGMMSVSSTAIVAKVLVDLKRTGNAESELILGMILFDDLFLALFMAIMSGLLLAGATSVGGVALSMAISIGYMVLFFLIAMFATPFLNRLLNISSSEVLIIVVSALLFFVAGFSEYLHVAEAIGALLLGLALSETEHSKRLIQLTIPFRDFFGAVFFFSFGLGIDPLDLGEAVWLAIGAALLTILANLVAGMLAGRKAGLSYRASTNIGLTVMARGEFTIIVANLGVIAGLMPLLKPLSALYVLILAILGPLLAKESKHIYKALDKLFGWSKKEKAQAKRAM